MNQEKTLNNDMRYSSKKSGNDILDKIEKAFDVSRRLTGVPNGQIVLVDSNSLIVDSQSGITYVGSTMWEQMKGRTVPRT